MKKAIAILLAALMVVGCVACTVTTESTTTTTTAAAPAAETKTEAAAPAAATEAAPVEEAAPAVEKDPYADMTMDELYELAKKEGGTIIIYSTSKDADKISQKFMEQFPELKAEYTKIATTDMQAKVELEASTGNVNADVVATGDNTGAIYKELVEYDLLDLYQPTVIAEKMNPEDLKYGFPMTYSFAPWFYNTEMYPDGCPIDSWWDIVEGYNVDTKSYVDASGNKTQKWTIFSKEISSPTYTALFSQLILDGDKVAEAYKAKFGKDVEITYTDKLQNVPGVMELPENNAGVELFWRLSQMLVTELDDGDAVVEAVHNSINGPTLGLASAGKIELKTENNYNIAWVYPLTPYTSLSSTASYYVTVGNDNPAGARLWIMYAMGGADGKEGPYVKIKDDTGNWSTRSDIVFENSGAKWEDLNVVAPDLENIYETFPNVVAYWTLWHAMAPVA